MQTSYTIGMAVGFPGMIADSAMVQDIETYYNPEGAVFFGRLVTKGAADGQIVHPDAAGEITDEKLVRGVVVATHEQITKYVSDGLVGSYVAQTPVPVMRKGRIWVLSENAVVEGTSVVYARHTANGGNTLLGSFRAGTDTGASIMPKAKFKSSTASAGLVVLEIDL